MMLKLATAFLVLICVSSFSGPVLPAPPAIRPFLTPVHYRVPADLAFPKEISDVLNAEALRHGKRVRPLLCFLAGGMLGVPAVELKHLACAVEFVHNASLIHDDVIDASTHRRQDPALWAKTTVKKAITIGDWLLAQAVRRVNRPDGTENVDRLLSVIEEMTRGEIRQSNLLESGTYTLDGWRKVAYSKTGILFGWALSAPAVDLKMDNEIIELYFELGVIMGQVFQAQDDIDDAQKGERGELNLLLLLASQHDKVSPLSQTFSDEALAAGRAGTLKYIQGKAKRMQAIVRRLKRLSDDWWGGRLANPYRDDCAAGLAALGVLFTTPPNLE